MTFSVNEFSSQLNRRSVAKQSNFDAFITFPARMAFPVGTASAVNQLRFRVDSAELPGRSIQTTQGKPYGNGLTHKFGYDVTYPEVTVSIICGDDLAEKSLFTAWQSLVIGKHATNAPYQRNMRIGYYSDYVSQVEINQYTEQGDLAYSVTLVEAFPVIVNSMPLSWASEEVHRLTVQFTYLHFVENTTPPSQSSPAPFINDLGVPVRTEIRNFADNLDVRAVNQGLNGRVNGGINVGDNFNFTSGILG